MIKLPDLLTLAAMKAYALGRRAKWKDYVDLYVIMREYYDIHKIIKRTRHIFGLEFNEKLFRAQLSYFKDIDYTEKIDTFGGVQTPSFRAGKDYAALSINPEQTTVFRPWCRRIDYLKGFEVGDEIIKKKLADFSLR